jgi:predicted XRE-type DNA-binding protein
MARRTKIEPGGGNIFADLGLPDAKTHLLKAQIVSEVCRLTTARKLTQAKAGARIGISQPEVSRLFNGHFREYSVDRLMGFLTAFDRDVEIVVRDKVRTGTMTDREGLSRLNGQLAHEIEVPRCDPFVAPLLYAIPVQLLAYHVAVHKGTDVDQPRNLAKSVTVG